MKSAEVNRLRLMHEAAIAKMEEEVARGRAQYVAAAAAEAASARAKIFDALGRATALEAELCAARTESAAASAALAALQSELRQGAQCPEDNFFQANTVVSDEAPAMDDQLFGSVDSTSEASALVSRTPDGANDLPENGSQSVEQENLLTSEDNVASKDASSSRASVDRVSIAVAEAEGVLAMLAGLIDDQSHVSGDQPDGNTAPATPDRQGPRNSPLNSNDASIRTPPSQSPETPQHSSPRSMGRDGLLSPPLDKALGMNPEEIDHYRGLTLKAWEASDSPAAAAASEHDNNHSNRRKNGSSPNGLGTRRVSITRGGGDDRSGSRSNVRRPRPFVTGLKATVAMALLAATAAYLLGHSTWLRMVERFPTSREGSMHCGAPQTPTELEAISEIESLTAATADAVEENLETEGREASEPAPSTLIEQRKRKDKRKEAGDAGLNCSFEGLAGLYLHTDWPSLQPQAPAHLVSVPLAMAMVNSVRDAQVRLRPQFTELCEQVHAQNSVQQAESEGLSNSNSGLDIDLTRTFGPEACTEDLLAQLDVWIRRNCQSNPAPGDGEEIV